MEYIQAQVKLAPTPELKSIFNELSVLYGDKLWHHLALKLEELSAMEAFQRDGLLIQLYENLISKCAKKLNPLSLVKLASATADQNTDAAASVAFLQSVQTVVNEDPQGSLYCKLETARRLVKCGKLPEVAAALDEARKALSDFPGVMDEVVHSSLYLAALDYHKVKGTASEFFRNALLYLTYTPLQAIPVHRRLDLAADVGLAALLGHDLYNFGELLQHSLMDLLRDSAFSWLHALLIAFHKGHIDDFKRIFAAASVEHKVLHENAAFLNQKVRIMAFVDYVSQQPSTERAFSFAALAKLCDTQEHEVELLIMKVFSLQVAKGSIDEVDRQVRITWVQPGTLDKEQLQALQGRLRNWAGTVNQSLKFLSDSSRELLSQQ